MKGRNLADPGTSNSSSNNKRKHEGSEEKAHQAEARLKDLLSQSNIFAREVIKSSDQTAKVEVLDESSTSAKNLQKDEKAIAKEGADKNDLETGGSQPTVLTQQPSIMSGGELRPYQLDGLNWMIRLQENGMNGILADAMNTGKTVQSISMLAYMNEFKKIPGPHLILAPKSALAIWRREFTQWCPSVRGWVFYWSGNEEEKISRSYFGPVESHTSGEWDVIIASYEAFTLEKEPLTRTPWRYVIFDEADRLKKLGSEFSQTTRLLTAQHRLLLTATPLQRNLSDLWLLLNLLLPDAFDSSEQFDEWFHLEIDDAETVQRMIGQLHDLLHPFMLRRVWKNGMMSTGEVVLAV